MTAPSPAAGQMQPWVDQAMNLVDAYAAELTDNYAPSEARMDAAHEALRAHLSAAPLSPAPQGWREAMQRALDALIAMQMSARDVKCGLKCCDDSIVELRALLSSPSSIEKAVPLSDEQILYFARHAADRIPASNYEGRVIHAVRMAELAKEPKNG